MDQAWRLVWIVLKTSFINRSRHPWWEHRVPASQSCLVCTKTWHQKYLQRNMNASTFALDISCAWKDSWSEVTRKSIFSIDLLSTAWVVVQISSKHKLLNDLNWAFLLIFKRCSVTPYILSIFLLDLLTVNCHILFVVKWYENGWFCCMAIL